MIRREVIEKKNKTRVLRWIWSCYSNEYLQRYDSAQSSWSSSKFRIDITNPIFRLENVTKKERENDDQEVNGKLSELEALTEVSKRNVVFWEKVPCSRIEMAGVA
jgi:hypothetical protein